MTDPYYSDPTVSFVWQSVGGYFASGDQSKTPEVEAFLNPDDYGDHVIVGVGGHVKGTDVDMIELMVAQIQTDGTLGSPTSVKFPEGSTQDSEVLCTLDDNQVAVGAGLRASGTEMSLARVYYRDWDPKTGLLTGDVEHTTEKASGYDGSDGPEQSWHVDDDVFLDQSVTASILTGIAAKATSHDGKANIDLMLFKAGGLAMSPRPEQTDDFRVALAATPELFRQQSLGIDDPFTIAGSDYYLCAQLSENAYIANKSDDYFQDGYRFIDGSDQKYSSRNDWASENDYTIIYDSTSFWRGNVAIYGDTPFQSTGNTRFIAFRGTEANLSDIYADLSGFPGAAANTWPFSMMNALVRGQTFAIWQDWTVHGGTVKVHSGFYQAYASIRGDVHAAAGDTLQNGGDVFLTGHSLGGAIAVIAAMDLYGEYGTGSGAGNIYIVTFGAPRVGDQTFADIYNATFEASFDYRNTRTLAFQDENDWIPWAPSTGVQNPASLSEGDFISVGKSLPLASGFWFPTDHQLQTYYLNLAAWAAPTTDGSTLTSDTPITDLKVEIYTGDMMWAGTDADVYCSIADNTFGPLTSDQNDFEKGDVRYYQLIDGDAPGNLQTVKDLFAKQLCFWIDTSVTWDWNTDWNLYQVKVFVNDLQLSQLVYDEWISDDTEDKWGRVIIYTLA